jgi:Alpha/beta hydrolase domain
MTRTDDNVRNPACSGPRPGEAVTTLGAFDLGRHGYCSEEWLLEGTASSWRAAGELGDDGLWETELDSLAPYRTRLVVCRPDSPTSFNGTVVVEWLNVSGGGDGSPDWFFLHRHLMREGAAWVGVSAQKAGIDGGGFFDSGQHLKAVAPERYGILSHPGDAFAFDIFSQAGLALRAGTGPLGGFQIENLLAVGESQSAVFLVTYINAIDQHAGIYDGFLVHGRGSSGATLEGQMFGGGRQLEFTGSQRIREDVRVPVITVQSETDLVMMAGVRGRQPDNDRFRWWEIAGAAHFDSYGLIASQSDDGTLSPAELAALIAPVDEVRGMKSTGLINSGPQQHYVLNAATAGLEAWVRHGTPPPSGRWIESEPGPEPALARDELGISRGGIRTPWVDTPVAAFSGQGFPGEVFTALFGSTHPFDRAQLGRLYRDGRAGYLAAFEQRLGEAIEAGFILAVDGDEIMSLASAACPLA